jgi:hypothetical protein
MANDFLRATIQSVHSTVGDRSPGDKGDMIGTKEPNKVAEDANKPVHFS